MDMEDTAIEVMAGITAALDINGVLELTCNREGYKENFNEKQY